MLPAGEVWAVDFRLFGPMQAWDGDRRVDLGHARQRCVLAVLLLEAGQVVPTAALLDRVWGHEPPDGALNTLYAYLARLRKALAPHRVQVIRGGGGYRADVDPDAVDVCRFRRLLAEAKLDSGAAQMDLLDAALALWRDPPLADASGGWLVRIRESLGEQRLSALLARNDARLRGGAPAEALDALRGLTTEYPVDERLVHQLMLALHLSGRPGDALAEYRQACRRFAAHSGIEPGNALRALHRRILDADPGLPQAVFTADASDRPACLPRDSPGFVGRDAELSELDRLAMETCALVTVDGTAGVGKTALAVHWAHRAAGRYPDGSLYADLQGYGPGPPSDPDRVLGHFLTLLGIAPARIPAAVDTKGALYRSLLRGRRVLVLLDNAADAQQIRPLLTTSPGSLVLVTSRGTLNGLVARDRARRLAVDVLPVDDAIALLAGFAGADRVRAEPSAARDLVMRCARLPVALCVAGERAAADPRRSLADLVGELADERRRLDVLDADGDPQTAVRAVFSWSYDTLKPMAAKVFRLLGRHPGADFDRLAVAALLDVEPAEAARPLDALVQAHLVEAEGAGRFRMHDLLRAYAAELAMCHDTEADRSAAQDRIFAYYSAAARAAIERLGTGRPLAEEADARAWLDTERANLVALILRESRDRETLELAAIVARDSLRVGRYADAATVFTCAVTAAQNLGDRQAQARALSSLGNIDRRLGRLTQAARRHRRALVLWRAAGDRRGEASTLGNLALVHYRRGEYEIAAAHFETVRAIFDDLGSPADVAMALGNLGIVAERQGDYEKARIYQHEVLALAVADRRLRSKALGNLGVVEYRLGNLDQAAAHLNEALDLCRHLGDSAGVGHALDNLGVVHRLCGRYDEAADHHRRAADLFRDLGETAGEAEALNGLGEATLAGGDPATAAGHHLAALALARRIPDRHEQARARAGLAAARGRGRAC